MSLRKSSRRRNGSKSEVLPKPKARRKCTPAPSSVGLDLMRRLTGRRDMDASQEESSRSKPAEQKGSGSAGLGAGEAGILGRCMEEDNDGETNDGGTGDVLVARGVVPGAEGRAPDDEGGARGGDGRL